MRDVTKLDKSELGALIPLEVFKIIPLDFLSKINKKQLVDSIESHFYIKKFSKMCDDHSIEVNNYDFNFDIVEESGKYFYELLDYQYYIRNKLLNSIENGMKKCIVHMPTGTGKTKTTCHILSELCNIKKNVRVIWLAHEEILVDQGYDEFSNTFSKLMRKNLKITHYKSAKKIKEIKSDEIIFITYQSLNKIGNLGIKLNADIIIADECHKSVARTFSSGIRNASKVEGNTILIGLSATPGRHISDKGENERISNFYDNNKITFDVEIIKQFSNDTIIQNDIFEYLYERKVLSRPNFNSINSSIDVDKLYSWNNGKHHSSSVINKALETNKERNYTMALEIAKLANEGKKIIVFASSIVQSEALSFMITCIGTEVVLVNGEITKNHIEKNMSKYKYNQVKVLIVVEKLTTGFDDPKIDCVYIARDTSSIILFSQMIGRGLRGLKMGGTEFCEVYHNQKYSVFEKNDELFKYFDENY